MFTTHTHMLRLSGLLLLLCTVVPLQAFGSYLFLDVGHNEYHIPFTSSLTFEKVRPEITAGVGIPVIGSEPLSLYGRFALGWSNQSAFQDAVALDAGMSGEWEIVPGVDAWLAFGGGPGLVIQKGVFRAGTDPEYQALDVRPAMQAAAQLGFRFRTFGVDSLYLSADYNFRLYYFAFSQQPATPFLPSGTLNVGLVWKLGRE